MKARRHIALFRLTDIIPIAAVLLLSAFLIIASKYIFTVSESPVLAIEANGTVNYYQLDKDNTVLIKSNNIDITVRISNGYAFIESSTCPDGVCRSMGKINKNGQTAICAPARVAIKIIDRSKNEVETDAVTR